MGFRRFAPPFGEAFARGFGVMGDGNITISPAILPSGDTVTAYYRIITASGGTAPYTYIIDSGALPDGLLLDAAGILSGIPTQKNSFEFTITAIDATGRFGSHTYIINIFNYSDKVLALFGSGLLGYWKQGEASGNVSIDSSGNGFDGVYSDISLGQSGIGDGDTSALYSASPVSSDNIYTAGLAASFNGDEFSILVWFKVSDASFWTDGKNQGLIDIRGATDGNVIDIYKSANSKIGGRYIAGGITKIQSTPVIALTGWVCFVMTVSKFGDRLRIFLNGAQSNTDITVLGVWSGLLTAARCYIGASVPPGANSTFPGYIQHPMIINREITKWEILQASSLNYTGEWTPQGTILEPATVDETTWIGEASILYSSGVFQMWYSLGTSAGFKVGYATSPDAIHWTKYSGNPILNTYTRPNVTKSGSVYYMTAISNTGGVDLLSSDDGVSWSLMTDGMITVGGIGEWDHGAIDNTYMWIEDGTWYCVYDGSNGPNSYQVGLITSPDGITWTKYVNNPVVPAGIYGTVGGAFVQKVGSGTWHLWAQVSPVGASGPTDIAHYTSVDLHTWTQTPIGFVFPRFSPCQGWFTSFGQVADVSMVEVDGTTYMIYSALPDGRYESHIELATAPLPIAVLANTGQGIVFGHKAEQLINGSFEVVGTGGADVWRDWTETAGDGVIVRTTTPDEVNADSSRIAAAKLTAGASANTILSQTLTILFPNATYSLSGYARGDGVNGGRIRIIDSASNDLIVWPTELNSSTVYEAFSVMFTAPANGQVTIYCECAAIDGGVAYFDDLSVKCI